MRLPNGEIAIIPAEKLRDYLLSRTHPVGRFKAEFFLRLGYTQQGWDVLEADIRRLLRGNAEEGEETEYGKKYLVRGTITGPEGRGAVLTVWTILHGEDVPRFITAYPESRV